MTETQKNRFDQEAESWDSNPTTRLSSEKVFHVIESRNLLAKDAKVLELGCGTGLLSTLVAPHVQSLLGVDTSEGMISKFDQKSRNLAYSNMESMNVLLEKPEQMKGKTFDLIISHLVFHHIPDMSSIIHTLTSLLNPKGVLLISDFERTPYSRAFHPESKMTGVERHGISKEEMRQMFQDVGLKDINVEVAFELEKLTETQEGSLTFPFLICIGRKA